MENLRTAVLFVVGVIIVFGSWILKSWNNSDIWSDTAKYLLIEVVFLAVIVFVALLQNIKFNGNFRNMPLVVMLFVACLFRFHNVSILIIINLAIYIVGLMLLARKLRLSIKKISLTSTAQRVVIQNYRKRGRV